MQNTFETIKVDQDFIHMNEILTTYIKHRKL